MSNNTMGLFRKSKEGKTKDSLNQMVSLRRRFVLELLCRISMLEDEVYGKEKSKIVVDKIQDDIEALLK